MSCHTPPLEKQGKCPGKIRIQIWMLIGAQQSSTFLDANSSKNGYFLTDVSIEGQNDRIHVRKWMNSGLFANILLWNCIC